MSLGRRAPFDNKVAVIFGKCGGQFAPLRAQQKGRNSKDNQQLKSLESFDSKFRRTIRRKVRIERGNCLALFFQNSIWGFFKTSFNFSFLATLQVLSPSSLSPSRVSQERNLISTAIFARNSYFLLRSIRWCPPAPTFYSGAGGREDSRFVSYIISPKKPFLLFLSISSGLRRCFWGPQDQRRILLLLQRTQAQRQRRPVKTITWNNTKTYKDILNCSSVVRDVLAARRLDELGVERLMKEGMHEFMPVEDQDDGEESRDETGNSLDRWLRSLVLKNKNEFMFDSRQFHTD